MSTFRSLSDDRMADIGAPVTTLGAAVALACAWSEEPVVVAGVTLDRHRVAVVYEDMGDGRTVGTFRARVEHRNGETTIDYPAAGA